MSNHPDAQLVVPEGFQMPQGRDALQVLVNVVSEDYFATAEIPVLRGRAFRETDDGGAPPVAVVNELFASRYYPNQNAVGKRFRLGGAQGRWVEIVGIAGMSKYQSVMERPLTFVYRPFAQNPRMQMTLMLNSAGASATLVRPLLDAVRALDSGQPVFAVRTIEEYIEQRSTMLLRLFTGLLAGMALLALALALSGLYAVMAWSVARRRREIGIRMALGADRAAVLGMVLRHGLLLGVVGSAIGLALSIAFGRALTSGLGAPPFNVPALVAVPAALVALTLAGAYIPARRAAQVEPVSVLKQD